MFSTVWLQNCGAGKFSTSEYAQTKVQYLLHLNYLRQNIIEECSQSSVEFLNQCYCPWSPWKA